MKRIISILLAIVFVLMTGVFLPTFAVSENRGEHTYYYEILNNEATITAYSGPGGDLTIPDELGGCPVTEIGSNAFYKCTDLLTVTIPDSVTSIGSDAFCECTSLTAVSISSHLISLGSSAFRDCNFLISVSLPDSLTSIGSSAFYGCSSLKTIEIPESVTLIGDGAFGGCSSLDDITVSKNNVIYHTAGNCLIETATKTLVAGTNSSIIPDDQTVTSIASNAFSGRVNLENITIPDSVTSIGERAFFSCMDLASIEITKNVTFIGWYAFSGCGSLNSIEVSANNPVYHSTGNCLIETATKTLLKGSNKSEIPNDGSVTSIARYAFWNCNALTTITIPNCVTSIDPEAFASCKSLEIIVLPFGITKIDIGVFYECTSLKSVVIPESVTRIESFAFMNCSSLTDITIPDGVVTIGASSFEGCTAMRSVSISETVSDILIGAFSGCISLENIFVSKNNMVYQSTGNCLIETASKTLILGCKNSVIPNNGSVKIIGSLAFENCTTLNAITIPASVTSIDYQAFSGCTSLTDVTIRADKILINERDVFSGCEHVTLHVLEDSDSMLYAIKEGIPYTTFHAIDRVFADVNENQWYAEAVRYNYDRALMTGTGVSSDGSGRQLFQGDNFMTRAELVMVLYNIEGNPSVEYHPIFEDVKKGQWFDSAVLWAYDAGIVHGKTRTTFDPDANITRQDIAVILYRYAAKYKGIDLNVENMEDLLGLFSDSSLVASYAKTAMAAMNKAGVIIGDGDRLKPQDYATRAEVAMMFSRYIPDVLENHKKTK